MPSVLIVEDSSMVMKILRYVAEKTLSYDTVFCQSREEALVALESRGDWLAAVVDLHLPDAPHGELVDDVLERGIPTIVLTAAVDEEKRDAMIRKGIVDYVQKEGRYSYQYALNLVNRLDKNRSVKVLVAEDSKTTRRVVSELLSRNLFQVVEAEDGAKALDAVLADPSIKILLTDYNMPNMDGFQLIRKLRHQHEMMDLMIIGLSSADDKFLSAKFIKNGANDFLYKPFSQEEFSCRILQAAESLERLEAMREMALTDSLTGIGNRRYLVEKGNALLEHSNSKALPLSLALINIDEFKHLNDDNGHDVGDEVLTYFSRALEKAFGRFVFARTFGDEFVVALPGLTREKAYQLLEAFRINFEQSVFDTAAGEVSCTFSCGIGQTPVDDFNGLLRLAESQLFLAKQSGRNKVWFD